MEVQFWLEDSELVGMNINNRVPESLIHELRESKANELTVVSNNAGNIYNYKYNPQ